MSFEKRRIQFTLPGYVYDFLEILANTLDAHKSEAIEECILYVSENLDDFLDQFDLTDKEEEEEEAEDLDEDEDEDLDEDLDEEEDEDEEDEG